MLGKYLQQSEKHTVCSMSCWWTCTEYIAQYWKEKLISISCQFYTCFITKPHCWWGEYIWRTQSYKSLFTLLPSPIYCVQFTIKQWLLLASSLVSKVKTRFTVSFYTYALNLTPLEDSHGYYWLQNLGWKLLVWEQCDVSQDICKCRCGQGVSSTLLISIPCTAPPLCSYSALWIAILS